MLALFSVFTLFPMLTLFTSGSRRIALLAVFSSGSRWITLFALLSVFALLTVLTGFAIKIDSRLGNPDSR